MPEAHTGPPVAAEEALGALVAAGGTAALLGDRDPVALLEAAASAAGRSFAHVDARGLRTATFDAEVRGTWTGDGWIDGALTRACREGGVFLLAHGEALLDDLRQRTLRMYASRRVTLTGPRESTDRTVEAAPGTALVLHVDDHVPVMLQVMIGVRRLPTIIRADVAGPPPLARR